MTLLETIRYRLSELARGMARVLLPNTLSGPSMNRVLRRRGARASVRTVIDVGASDGRWTVAARPFFGADAYLLIEAQAQPHEAALRRLKSRMSNIDYVIAAAGNREGTIHFDASDPLSGAASDQPFEKNDIAVPATTIDSEVSRRGLQGPFLIKLDTHGFEVPILEGAAKTLRQTEVIVVEVYNFKFSKTCLRFHELCAWLEERGFRCVDICDIMHRPHDGALWQMDLVFVPAKSPEFQMNSYSP